MEKNTTSERKRSGPPSLFGPKEFPNKSYSLTREAKDLLAKAARRANTSESNVVELLARRHAKTVRAADFLSPDEL